jgi:hypothetical protein
MAGLGDRLRRLEDLEEHRAARSAPTYESPARARMKEHLDELAAAKREGRPPSAEAPAISEAIERRRQRETREQKGATE